VLVLKTLDDEYVQTECNRIETTHDVTMTSQALATNDVAIYVIVGKYR